MNLFVPIIMICTLPCNAPTDYRAFVGPVKQTEDACHTVIAQEGMPALMHQIDVPFEFTHTNCEEFYVNND